MDNQQSWVEALNINPEKLNEWSTQAPAGKPLLVWCLEEGHVPLADYLQWASEHFQLPILSSAFFEHGGLDRSYFETQKGHNAWSPWCFPVDEWEGLTYVACIEPPEDPPGEVRYVLADPRVMRDTWETTGTGVKVIAPAVTATADPVETGAPPAPPKAPTLDMEALSKAAPLDMEALEKSVVLSDLTPPEQSADEAEAEPAPEPDAPMGIEMNPTKSFHLNLDESTLFRNGPLPPDMPDAPAEAMSPAEINGAAEPATQTSLSVVLNNASEEADTPPPVQLFDDVEPQSSPDLSPPTALHRISVAPQPLNLPKTEEAALAKVFSFIDSTYNHSCLLKWENDTAAKLYRADATLHPAAGTKAEINLTYPSFLRIVAKTGQPYHGYLVDSPVHREFFTALGVTELPACVTAVPLRVDGKIWGALLAIGGEELQNLENLGIVDGAAEQLVQTLGPTWKKKAG